MEVISTLIQKKAIDVVITSNGKEYVTRRHLRTEIRNECLSNDGRVAVTDLVSLLNVGLDHIESETSALINEDDFYIRCSGEVLSRSVASFD